MLDIKAQLAKTDLLKKREAAQVALDKDEEEFRQIDSEFGGYDGKISSSKRVIEIWTHWNMGPSSNFEVITGACGPVPPVTSGNNISLSNPRRASHFLSGS